MNQKSFTLIEILISVIIVAIIATFIIVLTGGVTDSAKDSQRKKDIDSFPSAIIASSWFGFPIESSDCNVGEDSGGTNPCNNLNSLLVPKYYKTLVDVPKDPSGSYYLYQSDGNDFTIKTILSDGSIYQYNHNQGFSTQTVLTGYNKRKQIVLSNSGSALTDHQILVSVSYDSDMQADFDDIRFVSGASELNYWLESKTDSVSANFWVKIPSIPNGISNIYMYYGNASSTSNSSGENTFPFFDHFEGSSVDTNKWTITGTPEVSSSICNISGTSGESITGKTSYGLGYVLRTSVKAPVGGWPPTYTRSWGFTGGGKYVYWAVEYSVNNAIQGLSYNTQLGVGTNAGSYAVNASQVYTIYEIRRISSSYEEFGGFWEFSVTIPERIPTTDLAPFVRLDGTTNSAEVDWLLIRKYATGVNLSMGGEESI